MASQVIKSSRKLSEDMIASEISSVKSSNPKKTRKSLKPTS